MVTTGDREGLRFIDLGAAQEFTSMQRILKHYPIPIAVSELLYTRAPFFIHTISVSKPYLHIFSCFSLLTISCVLSCHFRVWELHSRATAGDCYLDAIHTVPPSWLLELFYGCIRGIGLEVLLWLPPRKLLVYLTNT